jgi:hypothetical protein
LATLAAPGALRQSRILHALHAIYPIPGTKSQFHLHPERRNPLLNRLLSAFEPSLFTFEPAATEEKWKLEKWKKRRAFRAGARVASRKVLSEQSGSAGPDLLESRERPTIFEKGRVG